MLLYHNISSSIYFHVPRWPTKIMFYDSRYNSFHRNLWYPEYIILNMKPIRREWQLLLWNWKLIESGIRIEYFNPDYGLVKRILSTTFHTVHDLNIITNKIFMVHMVYDLTINEEQSSTTYICKFFSSILKLFYEIKFTMLE